MTKIAENGGVQWSGGDDLENAVAMLSALISYDSEVPAASREGLTRKAVFQAKKDGGITMERVLGLVFKEQKAYLSVRPRRFVLLTSVPLKAAAIAPVSLGTTVIRFVRGKPAAFGLPDGGSLTVKDNTPIDFTRVKVHVSARDPIGAVELAFDDWDFIRGLWNLHFNRLAISRHSLGAPFYRPVNKAVAGPFHTIHYPSGKLALTGRWWHTPNAEKASVQALYPPQYSSMKKFEQRLRTRLKRITFANPLRAGVVRYVRALDEGDLTTAFLQLWSVLEELTGTRRGNNDILVKRTAFLYSHAAYARIALEYLRDQRNSIVHAGSQADDAERLVYQLKHLVETFITFGSARCGEFDSWDDFLSFLDLPPNPMILRQRLKRHQSAYRLHRDSKG